MGFIDSSGNSHSMMDRSHHDDFGKTEEIVGGKINRFPDSPPTSILLDAQRTPQNLQAMDHKKHAIDTVIKIILDQLMRDLDDMDNDAAHVLGSSQAAFIRNKKWMATEKARISLLQLTGYGNE